MTYKAKPEYRDNFPYLIQLLAGVLNEEKPPKPTAQTDWASVFSMAELHSVAGMVYYAVMNLDPDDRPQEDIINALKSHYQEQLVIEANVQYETDLLLKEFDKQGICALPVKGILLKNDYPEPSMRTMTDVDILYKEEHREQVIKTFNSFGYKLKHEINDQLDFVKEPFHHYEMHSKLLPPQKTSHSYYENIWDRVDFSDNSHIGRLNADDTYIYLLEHLAKHFEGGGAGIRLVMDVYVFYRAHVQELNREYLNKELEKLDLTQFEETIRTLAYDWFGGSVPNTDSSVADFILCSCTFGTSRDALLQSAIRSENKSGKKHSGFYRIFRRIFPTYTKISSRFPSARKGKVLYPFYIPAYWCLRLFKDRNITAENLGYYFEDTDSDNAKRLKSIMCDLGLTSRM